MRALVHKRCKWGRALNYHQYYYPPEKRSFLLSHITNQRCAMMCFCDAQSFIKSTSKWGLSSNLCRKTTRNQFVKKNCWSSQKKKDKKSYLNVSRCWDLEWEVSSRNSNRATQNKAGRDRQWKISRKLVRNVSKDSRTTAKTLETQENDLTKSGIVMPKKTFTGTSHMEWTVSIDQEKVHFCRRDAFKPDWSILRTTSRMIRYTTSLSRDVLSACL